MAAALQQNGAPIRRRLSAGCANVKKRSVCVVAQFGPSHFWPLSGDHPGEQQGRVRLALINKKGSSRLVH